MNIHKKLKKLGFKSSEPVAIQRDGWRNPGYMSFYTKRTKYDGESWNTVVEKVKCLKCEKFYKLDYNKLTIWIKTKQSDLYNIWLEGSNIEDGVKEIYNFNEDKGLVKSKSDIFDKLPKEIRRDFILKDIFND